MNLQERTKSGDLMAGFLILITDDEPMQRELLEEYLKLSHYRVIHAKDGNQCLEMMQQHEPDLVLLDIQMPGMDGFATLTQIRKIPAIADTPVLFLSSLDRQHLKVKGLELGADDYITKPFHPPELLARVKASLRRTMRYRKTEGLMAGDLANVALTDLLQSMELGAKTAAIRLEGMKANIYLEDGALVHASMGPFTGENALERMFLMEKGPFKVQFDQLPEDLPKGSTPLMAVLMNVLAEVDEINAHINRMSKVPVSLEPGPAWDDPPGLKDLMTEPPTPLRDLTALMGGSLKENLLAVVDAVKKGKLKPSKPRSSA